MLDDVVLIMGGEMGRTPKVDNRGGRDHWPVTGVTVMAGGGLKTGQVVGDSDARGERPNGRPITPQMMIATLYQALGIDPSTTINDHAGRPQYLLDHRFIRCSLVVLRNLRPCRANLGCTPATGSRRFPVPPARQKEEA